MPALRHGRRRVYALGLTILWIRAAARHPDTPAFDAVLKVAVFTAVATTSLPLRRSIRPTQAREMRFLKTTRW